MNIYLISQTQNSAYDTFDSAVVISETLEKAKTIHPQEIWGNDNKYCWENNYNTWCNSPENVSVEFLGIYQGVVDGPVLVASFNAG